MAQLVVLRRRQDDVVGQVAARNEEGLLCRWAAAISILETIQRGGRDVELRVGDDVQFDVGSQSDAKLRCVEIADDGSHIHGLAFRNVGQLRDFIDIDDVVALGQRGVAAGVDGADDGTFNLDACSLQRSGGFGACQHFADGLHGHRQGVARRQDAEFFGVVAVDARKLDEAVVECKFSAGLNHVAQSQSGRHSAVVQKQVDAARVVLDVDVAVVDEGHNASHQGIIVGGQCASLGDGLQSRDVVSGSGHVTCRIAALEGLGFDGGGLGDGQGSRILRAAFVRGAAIEGVADGGSLGGAVDAYLLALKVCATFRIESGCSHGLLTSTAGIGDVKL